MHQLILNKANNVPFRIHDQVAPEIVFGVKDPVPDTIEPTAWNVELVELRIILKQFFPPKAVGFVKRANRMDH